MKRSIIVAALLMGLSAPAAQAAPSMSIDRVISPIGPAESNGVPRTDDHTTWHVGLYGIGAWDHVGCSSTAYYKELSQFPEDGDNTREGEDADPNGPWDSWSFTAQTPAVYVENPEPDPYGVTYTFMPLQRIDASCELTRTVYVGRRYYRMGQTLYRDGSATSSRHPNGCLVYSYSAGELTIDCRHSRSSGSATWTFGIRRTDRVRPGSVYFDRRQSTMGPHSSTIRRRGRRAYVTETVSPGTMITVTEVEVPVSRLYSRKVYRHDSKTLSASWPS